MAVSKFRQRGATVAREFVQTVVLIDDEAFSSFIAGEEGITKLEAPQLAPSDPKDAPAASVPESPKPSPAEHATADSIPGAVKATKDEIAQELDARRLVALFAKEGLVCGVLQPRKTDAGLKEEFLAAARRADVVILDWVIHKDDGATAKGLVKQILEEDADARLRLIIIYTGYPDVDKVTAALKEVSGVQLEKGPAHEPNTLVGAHTRIAVLSKPSTVTQKLSVKPVQLEELPARVFVEFAALSSGLVSNAALNGIAVVRANTHKLLARLSRKLDPAFLTHRLLLQRPDDAHEFLTDLVGQEIASLLHSFEVGAVSDMAAIADYIEVAKVKPTADGVGLGIADAKALLEIVQIGVQAFARTIKDDKKRETFEPEVHRAGTKILVQNKEHADDIDRQFAFVASIVHRYSTKQPPPRLTLGSVLAVADDQFFVCIQPVCDCVRVDKARRFAFVTAAISNSPNLIVRVADKAVRLKVSSKASSLVQYTFSAANADVVYGTASGEDFEFSSEEPKTVFKWCGQMKFPQAQRLAQQFSANLARVGLDESEWLRRFDAEP